MNNVEADVQAIKRVGEEYFQASNSGDLERCLATMADDVVVMPPGRPAIAGKVQLGRLSSEYHGKYDVEYRLSYDEVVVAGELGFARSTATGTRRSKSDSTVEAMAWRNVWILKRQPSGEWKFWRVIFNSPS